MGTTSTTGTASTRSAAAEQVHLVRFGTAMGPMALACTARGVVASSLPGQGDAPVRRWLAARMPGAAVVEHTLEGEPADADAARAERSVPCTAGDGGGGQGLHRAAVDAVRDFLTGLRTDLELPLDLRGTEFQCAVWSALRGVPYGQTVSYAELARRVGRPTAVRAVGAANGANPLPLFVPCHRVIASDGSLCGFGGGLPLKRRLLELEAERAGLFASGPAAARSGRSAAGPRPSGPLAAAADPHSQGSVAGSSAPKNT